MKKAILLLTAALFISCNTYHRQLGKFQAFALQHQTELAKLCTTVFPVKDSVGATVVDSTHKANNVNYQAKIDSLQEIVDLFSRVLAKDTVTGNSCAPVARAYQKQVDALKVRIASLQAAYKPCKPDIVYKTKTVYRIDEAQLTVTRNKYGAAHDSVTSLKVQLTDTKKQSGNRLLWLFILGGVIVVILVAFYFLNRFIKLNI